MKKQFFLSLIALISHIAYADDFTFINKTVEPISLWANQSRCTQPVGGKTAVLYVANYVVELCSDNPTNCEITLHHSTECSGEPVASVKLIDGKLMEVGAISQGYHVYANREENILSLTNIQ